MIKIMWNRFLDLLFPPKCIFCRCIVEEIPIYCPCCTSLLPWHENTSEVGVHSATGLVVYAPFWYRDQVAQSMRRYKFSGCQSYAPYFGKIMADCLPENFSVDLISWAPLSSNRKKQRGYDQARLLAEEVAICLEIPVASLLVKVRHNRAQSGLAEEEERWRNAENCYVFQGDSVKGKRILLVDDVFTTGATLGTCAKVLKEQGAEAVFCLCFARARK